MQKIKNAKLAQLRKILDFIHAAEPLKHVYRHAQTSRGCRESVAAHCWRLCMMIMFFGPCLHKKKFNFERALKMAVIHDIAEVDTGDVPSFVKEGQDQQCASSLHCAEREAILRLKSMLPTSIALEFEELIDEYETGSTYEAKVVKALDKIEAQIQHNEMDYAKWSDYDRANATTRLNQYCVFDSTLDAFRRLVQQESLDKMSAIEQRNQSELSVSAAEPL